MKDAQFETLAIIRAYAEQIIAITNGQDIRPSTAASVCRIVAKMHIIMNKLEVN